MLAPGASTRRARPPAACCSCGRTFAPPTRGRIFRQRRLSGVTAWSLCCARPVFRNETTALSISAESPCCLQHRAAPLARAKSAPGTFAKCRPTLELSVYRGSTGNHRRTVKMARLTHFGHLEAVGQRFICQAGRSFFGESYPSENVAVAGSVGRVHQRRFALDPRD